MIAKLICLIRGHKRGRRLSPQDGESPASWTLGKAAEAYKNGFHIFQCPRCTAAWTRKARAT